MCNKFAAAQSVLYNCILQLRLVTGTHKTAQNDICCCRV